MIDKLKQEVMRRGMKVLSDPRVMKVMADPRFMNAITQGFAIKGRVQSEMDSKMRCVASALNLATKQDLEHLEQTLRQVESSLNNLERKS